MPLMHLNREELAKLAAEIAAGCKPPFLLALYGPLGAGKSFFCTAFIKALGCNERVTSPTYSVLNEYSSPKGRVIHIDAYRIKELKDLESTGFFELLDDSIVLVEWAENVENYLPANRREIRLEYKEDGRDVYLNF